MSEQQFSESSAPPAPEEYIGLRRTLGWGTIGTEDAAKTLAAATFTLCLRDAGRLAAVLRILGDGVLYLFIADVMVHPDYAGRGLGERLMRAAVYYIDRVADPAATVTLIPLAGREGFYERFGFVRCPSGHFGEGMAYTKHMAGS